MEHLALIGMVCALPGVAFILAAKVTGSQKWIANLLVKVPSLVYCLIAVIMILKHFSII